VKVVREGQARRAPIERVADMLTGYFVPVVTLLAIVTWVIWLSLGQSGTLPPDYLDISIGGWRKTLIITRPRENKKLTSFKYYSCLVA
jgi:P-type Cu+ transporter